MLHILETYEKALGQVLNKEKNSIFFNKIYLKKLNSLSLAQLEFEPQYFLEIFGLTGYYREN